MRVNEGFLRPFERWALPRVARALPRWVTPDGLTALALAAAVGGGVAYALAGENAGWLWIASGALAVHWFGDSLDGTLARVRDERRERYGFFVDHTCDALSVVVLCVGVGAGSLMRMELALGLALAVLGLMLHVMMVTVARGTFKLSFGRIGPTELRLLLVAFNTVAWALGTRSVHAFGTTWTVFEAGALAVTVGVVATWAGSAVREARALDRLDAERADAERR